MRVANTESIPPQADMLSNGMQVSGTASGPVNTEEADRDFFTDPRMDEGSNSGRLFYHQFFLRNPHDPHLPERRVWFICWSPLDDGERAQRLPEKEGFLISEVTTDGRTIQVHHAAYAGSATWVDTFRWSGDALGRGRFERVGEPTSAMVIPQPTPFEIERDRGYGLLSADQPDQAVAAFEKALTLRADDAAVLFALGVAWEGQARVNPDAVTKAIEAYGRALVADPKRSPAYQRRAELYERQRQPALAIADLTRLISLEPESWQAHLDRARLHFQSGDRPKAIEDVQEAIRKAPTEVSPLETLALYQYLGGQWAEAIATGRRVLALDDSRTAVRVTMACAQARLGHAPEALKEYRDAQLNGVSATERRWGIRELARSLGKLPKDDSSNVAIRRLLEQLRGPEALEAGEEGPD